MPATEVLPYEDSAEARAELAPFLSGVFQDGPDEARWLRRLAHWWDENPFCAPEDPRGWVLRCGGRLAGFLGVIPARYAAQGKAVAALCGTSWYIEEGHRNAALPMLMAYQRLSRERLLVETTPSPEVRALLERGHWLGERRLRRVIQPCGAAGWISRWMLGERRSVLRPGRRVVTDVDEVRSLARPWQQEGRFEKWITPEYLRWYAASTMRRHLFAGVVDEAGCLTTFAWFTPRGRGPTSRLIGIESFSTEPDAEEWRALARVVARRGASWPGLCPRWLSFELFESDALGQALPGIPAGILPAFHYHKKPPALAWLPKHSVMAEGDFGL